MARNRKLADILAQRSDGNDLVARAAPIIQSMRTDVSEAIAHALQSCPNSEHVMVQLMEHDGSLLKQANQLAPQDVFAATLRLAGRLEEASNGHPRAVAVSRAPAPIKPLGHSSTATVEQDPSKMSLPEYRKWYDRNFTRGRR
jgi:hypothetical protein